MIIYYYYYIFIYIYINHTQHNTTPYTHESYTHTNRHHLQYAKKRHESALLVLVHTVGQIFLKTNRIIVYFVYLSDSHVTMTTK